MLQEKQNAGKKTLKTKVKKRLAKKKAVFSNRVKKIFDSKDESLGVVMFDYDKSDGFSYIPVSSPVSSEISINIVSHPLDQYSSPHVLNLATQKYIERVKPSLDSTLNVNYQDLPGGDFLTKIGVFELLSLEDSEIINFVKKTWKKIDLTLKKFIYQVDMSPKLPLTGKTDYTNKLNLWQEISVINLIIFLSSKVVNFFGFIGGALYHSYNSNILQHFKRDEVFDFQPHQESVVTNVEYLPKKSVVAYIPPAPKFNFSFENIFKNITISRVSLKPMMAFFAIALVIAIPIRSYFYLQSAKEAKGKVLGQAEEALFSLESAQSALEDFNLTDAQKYMTDANHDFVSAQDQLTEIKSFLTVLAETIPLNNTFRSGKNLLDLGEKLTKAGEYLISGLGEFSGQSDFSLSSRIKNFKTSNHEALAQLESAQENLNKININHLPESNQEKFSKLKDNLPKFIASLKKSDETMQFAIDFLGEKDLKKYLIIFQNDNELRAAGGFMGSLALADFKNGNLVGISMPAGGTYDLRAGFTKLLQSPEPLRLVNPKWEFQDANWWSDFPTSANNIAYFYNKSDGATIDGVIAINSDWLGSLLDVVGPIEMPDYGKTISSANFELELQKSVEIEYTDKKEPKKILGDLAPKLIESIFNVRPDNVLDLVSVFSKGLKDKDIQVYLFDENEQNFVAKNNWDGRIKDTQKDYLSVVATNIGGGKTDGVVNQEIYHKASVLDDGSVIDSVIINRSNFGPIDDNFTNVSNRSFIRVYVPLGSELIKAEGFKRPDDKEFREPDDYLEIDERLANEKMAIIDTNSLTKIYNENNKTVFANWITLKPGESKEVLLVYKLPFKINLNKDRVIANSIIDKVKAVFQPQHVSDSYSLLVQKQSGSHDDKFVSKLVYPKTVSANVSYPADVENNTNESVYRANINQDLFYFVGLKN